MADQPDVVYADDADAFVDRIITNASGANITGTTALVALDGGAYNITATWQGVAAPTRTLRIPLVGVAVGPHRLYQQVAGGTDFEMNPPAVVATRM